MNNGETRTRRLWIEHEGSEVVCVTVSSAFSVSSNQRLASNVENSDRRLDQMKIPVANSIPSAETVAASIVTRHRLTQPTSGADVVRPAIRAIQK